MSRALLSETSEGSDRTAGVGREARARAEGVARGKGRFGEQGAAPHSGKPQMSGGCGAGCSCGSQVAVETKVGQLLGRWEAQCVEYLLLGVPWAGVDGKWEKSVNWQDVQESLCPFLDAAFTRGELCEGLLKQLCMTDWHANGNPLNIQVRRRFSHVSGDQPLTVRRPGGTGGERRWIRVRLKNKEEGRSPEDLRAFLLTPPNTQLGDAQDPLADAQVENATLQAEMKYQLAASERMFALQLAEQWDAWQKNEQAVKDCARENNALDNELQSVRILLKRERADMEEVRLCLASEQAETKRLAEELAAARAEIEMLRAQMENQAEQSQKELEHELAAQWERGVQAMQDSDRENSVLHNELQYARGLHVRASVEKEILSRQLMEQQDMWTQFEHESARSRQDLVEKLAEVNQLLAEEKDRTKSLSLEIATLYDEHGVHEELQQTLDLSNADTRDAASLSSAATVPREEYERVQAEAAMLTRVFQRAFCIAP